MWRNLVLENGLLIVPWMIYTVYTYCLKKDITLCLCYGNISMFSLVPERKCDFRNIKLKHFYVFSILITTMRFLRLRKGISSVIEVTPCIHSTLTRRRMAMTLLMQGGEEPRWMNSSEAQSWADRYFTENTNKLCSANQ